MINKNIKKNAWIAIVCFILTFLPLGAYSTNYGTMSLLGLSILLIASLLCWICWRLFFNPLSSEPKIHQILVKIQQKAARILFLSNEQKFCIFVFITPIIISVIIGKIFFENLPFNPDSLAQYSHSRLLTMGLFSVSTHSFPDFFPMANTITTGGKWYSQYQLGHLLPLALGHLLGIIWLIDPIECGISALILYLIAYDNYGKKIARITGLLTIFCTQWWLMASEYMNHNTSLLGCLLFVWAWLRLIKIFDWKYSFLAGFGIGLALITRPISSFPVAFPFAIYGFYKLWHEPIKRQLVILPAAIVTIAFIAWQLYFNLQTTGEALLFAPEKLYGDQVKYGFGHIVITDIFNNFYKGTAHTFWRGIGHLANNLIGLNFFLFNWAIPSLIFVFIGVMIFRPSVITKLMLCSWVLLAIAYIPYFFQDLSFGTRYMYEITGFLIIATAVGIVRIPATLRVFGWRMKQSEIILKTNLLLCLLFLSGGFLFFSVMQKFSSVLYTYDTPTFQLDAKFPDNSLVFANKSYYQLTIFMPPLDSNRVIYAKDLGVENKKLIDYYPNRKVFLEINDGFKEIKFLP